MVIELLMNSMYGKAIIKPNETDTVVNDNQDVLINMSYNCNYIYYVLNVNDRNYIKNN